MPAPAQPNPTPADLVIEHLAADALDLADHVVEVESENRVLHELVHAAVALLHADYCRRSHRRPERAA